jgi:hypothetical protein
LKKKKKKKKNQISSFYYGLTFILYTSRDYYLKSTGDLPDTDDVIRVTREESGTISRPTDRQTVGIRVLSLTQLSKFRTELVNNRLGLEIPDLDTVGGSSTEPVTVGGESKSVNKRTSFQRVEVLGIVQVPEHDNTVLTSGSTERTIGRDGNSVDITVVADEVGTELELGQIPDLDELVPTTRNDDRVGRVGGETDTRDPFGVTIFGDVVLALTQGVPELDRLITRTRDDLTVISREADRQNIVGVTDETTSGGTVVQVPETEGLIPRGGQSELTVRRDSKIFNEVGVTNKRLTGDTVVQFISKCLYIAISDLFSILIYPS